MHNQGAGYLRNKLRRYDRREPSVVARCRHNLSGAIYRATC